jgi:hypothetical protein
VLIRRMSIENPLWGAPRIHGELLKLGFEVAQSSVAKYMVKRRVPPSQGWRTFLHNHAPDIAAMDLFVVPTIGFDLIYAYIIVRLDRIELVWISVTTHPAAEWVARQITEPFPWNEAPRYMIVTGIASEIELMARSLPAGFGRSAFETARRLPAHLGKTPALGRTAPSIWPDLIYGSHTQSVICQTFEELTG